MFRFLLVGLLSVHLTGTAFADPVASQKPQTRPMVRALLKDGSLVEGVLYRFDAGVYTLDDEGTPRIFREEDVRSIAFQPRKLAPEGPEADGPSIAELISRLHGPGIPLEGSADQATARLLIAKGPAVVEPLLEAIKEHESVANTAVVVLGALGPDIVPQLVHAARHDDGTSRLGWTVKYGLERIGIDALPYLREMLDDPEPDIRELALEVLGGLSAYAHTSLPKQFEAPLLRALRDPVADVRAKVPQIFARFGRGSGAVVPALVEAVADDPHAPVRYSTVIALRYIGTDLKEDEPELKTIIDALCEAVTTDAHETVRIYAASALGAFGPRAKAAVPALRQAADDERARVRDKAQLALHQIGVTLQEHTTAEARLAALVRQLTSREWELQRAAIDQLAALGPDNLDALMGAVRLDHENRYWTAVAQVIGKWNGRVLPELGRIVREEEHYRVRRTVAMAIGWMPLRAMPDELRPLLHDENDWVRSTAVDSLARLSQQAPHDAVDAIVDALVEALHDKQLSVRERAFRPLDRIGAGNPKIVLALVQILREDPEPRARQQAVSTLGSIVRRLRSDDEDFLRILDALAEAVRQDGDEYVRRYAISALGSLGERARPALSVLRVAEDDPLESIARAAREAVRKVTAPAPSPARRSHLPEPPPEAPAPPPPEPAP